MEKTPEDLLCAAAIAGDNIHLLNLLSNGADPSYFNSDGMTPLMLAAAGGHAGIIRCLLSAGAPWNALSPSNLSAGDLATKNSHQEALDILLNFAVQSELILGAISRAGRDKDAAFNDYLSERLDFGEDRIVDEERKAVMMAWERPLMEAHARAVCAFGDVGGRVLNVGFGMGLVDEAIQRYGPLEHVIVEAHPEVYDRMMRCGWGEKENVKIVFGKWQDVVSQLGSFDGIFFDTYGEYYEDMREFHQHLHRLLKPGGIYSYFNGFCGSNAFFHVVYCQLVALELGNLGYSTQFIPLAVKECLSEDTWKGVSQKYWQLDTYNLPVCQPSNDSE